MKSPGMKFPVKITGIPGLFPGIPGKFSGAPSARPGD